METGDYLIAWSIYLLAAGLLSRLAWPVYRKYLWRELAYLCQCTMMALFFTPWYVLPEEEILAPAIIIFSMDLITQGPTEAIRALIPLVMAVLLGLIVTLVLSVIYRIRKHQGRR